MGGIYRFLAVVRRKYAGHEWVPVTVGRSGAGVWRLVGRPAYFVKVHAAVVGGGSSGLDLAAEAERFEWLARWGVPTAEVVEVGERDGVAWLVTVAVPGRSAAEPWPAADRAAVVDALADVVAQLHAVPVDGCPFDRRLAVSVAAAEAAARGGRVDLGDLDEQRAGWSAARLLAELTATRPAGEDLAVCHGDLCLPNVLLDPRTLAVTGLVDVGRLGVADRYADLALATRSLGAEVNGQYGEAYAERFLARYGVGAPDRERLAFYRLLDEFF